MHTRLLASIHTPPSSRSTLVHVLEYAYSSSSSYTVILYHCNASETVLKDALKPELHYLALAI